MLIVGSDVFRRSDGDDLYKLLINFSSNHFTKKQEYWNGFNILHKEVGNVGALDLGIKLYNKDQKNRKAPKVLYLLNCDNFNDKDISKDIFVIYQGSHGDKGAERADVILPGSTYLEKNGTYVSTDGRVDRSLVCVTSQYLAKDDWEIFRALSEVLNINLPYDDLHELRDRICELAPHLLKYDHNEPHGFENLIPKFYENDKINLNNTKFVDTVDVKIFFKFFRIFIWLMLFQELLLQWLNVLIY